MFEFEEKGDVAVFDRADGMLLFPCEFVGVEAETVIDVLELLRVFGLFALTFACTVWAFDGFDEYEAVCTY